MYCLFRSSVRHAGRACRHQSMQHMCASLCVHDEGVHGQDFASYHAHICRLQYNPAQNFQLKTATPPAPKQAYPTNHFKYITTSPRHVRLMTGDYRIQPSLQDRHVRWRALLFTIRKRCHALSVAQHAVLRIVPSAVYQSHNDSSRMRRSWHLLDLRSGALSRVSAIW